MRKQNLERAKFEFERQKFLYKYWNDAEKIELAILSAILVSVIIPTFYNLDFSKIDTYISFIIILGIVVFITNKVGEYREHQKKIRDAIEKIKI